MEKKLIKLALEPYEQDARYLKDFNILRDEIIGEYNIKKSIYVKKEFQVDHLNFTDLTIGINQLSYIHLGYQIEKSLAKGFDFRDFEQQRISQALIISADKIKFRKVIDCKNFKISLTPQSKNPTRQQYFFKAYDKNNGLIEGEISSIFRLKK